MFVLRRALSVFAFFSFIAVAIPSQVLAQQAGPPQILGLVATAAPTPLTCERGRCWAEFSTFCLQQHRAAPFPETDYRAAAGTRLTLHLTDGDGTVRQVDAAPHVRVRSARIFASVRISVPESALREMGADGAALSVGPLASLVPVKTADPQAPESDMTAEEIALYTGPLRAAAQRFAEPGSTARVTAETALKLVNADPNADYGRQVDADALWRRAVGPLPGPDAAPAVKRAARLFRDCHRDLGGDAYLVNGCLREVHDLNMVDTTNKVWKGLAAGS